MAKQKKALVHITKQIPWKKLGDDGILLEIPESCRPWFAERCEKEGYSSYIPEDGITGFNGLEATEFALNAVAECPTGIIKVLEVCYRGYSKL